jgi:hypothetical protein
MMALQNPDWWVYVLEVYVHLRVRQSAVMAVTQANGKSSRWWVNIQAHVKLTVDKLV